MLQEQHGHEQDQPEAMPWAKLLPQPWASRAAPSTSRNRQQGAIRAGSQHARLFALGSHLRCRKRCISSACPPAAPSPAVTLAGARALGKTVWQRNPARPKDKGMLVAELLLQLRHRDRLPQSQKSPRCTGHCWSQDIPREGLSHPGPCRNTSCCLGFGFKNSPP